MRSGALAGLALLLGCGADPQPAASKPEPQRERVVLSPLGVSLSVPSDYAVYPRGEDSGGPWVVDLNPGGRQPLQVVLDPSGPDTLERPSTRGPGCPWQGPVSERFADDNGIRYYRSVGCGGSGGVEAALVGLWDIGDRRLVISCIAQQEPSFGEDGPDPLWCLELLRSARAVPATDTPPRLGPTGVEQRPLVIAPPLAGGQSSGEAGE
jgi:hypothetical protein